MLFRMSSQLHVKVGPGLTSRFKCVTFQILTCSSADGSSLDHYRVHSSHPFLVLPLHQFLSTLQLLSQGGEILSQICSENHHAWWREETFYLPAGVLSLDLTSLASAADMDGSEVRNTQQVCDGSTSLKGIGLWSQAGKCRTPLRADWTVLNLTGFNSWAPQGRDIPRRGNRK